MSNHHSVLIHFKFHPFIKILCVLYKIIPKMALLLLLPAYSGICTTIYHQKGCQSKLLVEYPEFQFYIYV